MKTLHVMMFMVCVAPFITGMANAQSSRENSESTKNKEVTMSSTERNKAVVRAIYEQSLNKRNLGLLKDLVSPVYTGIKGVKGVAAFEEPVAAVLRALPDAQWHIETLLAEGDRVFVRWKLTGTHTGPFQTLPATGHAVTNDGMAIYELKEDKVMASQVFTDRLNFLQQLGVLPADITVLYQKVPVKE